MNSRRGPQFQTRTFEAGFEPAVTAEQKESINNARQGINNAVHAVNQAAVDAHNALDQSLKGHRHLVTVGISSESMPCEPERPGLLSSTKETVGDTVQTVKEKLFEGAESAKSAVGGALGGAKELGQEAVDTTKSFAENAYEKASNMFNAAKEGTVNAAEKAYSKTANLMGNVKDTAGEKLDEAVDSAKGLKQMAENKLSSMSNSSNGKHSMTLEEVERRGLTADYPALLRGYDQNLPSYTYINEMQHEGVGDMLNEAGKDVSNAVKDVGQGIVNATSNVGHGIASATSDVGHGIANAASGAFEASKDFIGSIGGRMKGAVNAVIGETPPDRELEQQGEAMIRESRLNPLLLQQQQSSRPLSSSNQIPAYNFVDKQELRAINQKAPAVPPPGAHSIQPEAVYFMQQLQDADDKFRYNDGVNRSL